jgi:CubicO group peptidase (beta-lactamase class C family)
MHNSLSVKTTALFTLLILFSFYSFAQISKAETEIEALMKKYKAVGLAVAVVKQGEIIYTHSFGLKDIASNTSLTDRDIFRIASISKSFSATSIMQLIEKNKLSLNDDFSDLVGFTVRNPKFPTTKITLKMVMSHTSSINDSEGYFNLDVINPAKNSDYAKCYNDYQPGNGYQYCNLNYNMVGTIIEKRHLLDPLGLYGGYCVDSLDKASFTTLYEYDAKNNQMVASPLAYNPRSLEINNYTMGYSTPIFSPTGGMKISATDLAKYMTMHMNYGKYNGIKIISKKNAKKMQTKLSDDENYGLAISNTTDLIDGKTMTGHTGSAYGLYSAMYFEPKDKFGFVVITNGCNATYTKGFVDIIRTSVNSLYSNLIKNNSQNL